MRGSPATALRFGADFREVALQRLLWALALTGIRELSDCRQPLTGTPLWVTNDKSPQSVEDETGFG